MCPALRGQGARHTKPPRVIPHVATSPAMVMSTTFNQTRAAEMLGATRRILKYRMDKLGIAGPDR